MPRPRPPEQLDIPLVWELDRPPLETAEGDPFPVSPERRGIGFGRLVGAAVADLGACLLAVALATAAAALGGASLQPGQLAVSAFAGLVAASWIAVGFLWGWGQTPGLNLLGAGAGRKVSLGRSLGFWLAWLLVLPLAGLPLLVGRRGARGAERLLGVSLSSR